jgi:hypothetical protein
MVRGAFAGLRRVRRRIAAATLAAFVLNWLGLALAPCAMAISPAPPAAAAPACPDHAAPASGAPRPMPAGHCAWCAGPAPASTAAGHDARHCAATPKPVLDSREATLASAPLAIALGGPVVLALPADPGGGYAAADPVLPPARPAPDRYCRRLE